ncbi:MAG: hypothetical protein A3H97_19840 [Acidobacteria bacterium RIFCSPLOWO2_02_FULL_65_29]|nr:MAG: hypothetical protein A3H97_19840 [Acidobacteria bacterium RIFCSPLOWO2_02_FULL_65_29]
MAICPACDAEVEVDELSTDVGDELSCPDCGENLVVNGTDPIELDFADEDDEDEDEDDDAGDEVDEDEDGDLDEDEEEQEDGDVDE